MWPAEKSSETETEDHFLGLIKLKKKGVFLPSLTFPCLMWPAEKSSWIGGQAQKANKSGKRDKFCDGYTSCHQKLVALLNWPKLLDY